MTDDVSRAEILDAVSQLSDLVSYGARVVYFLAALIVIQIVIKIWETGRVVTIGHRVEKQLDMAALHGQVTDSQKDRMARLLERAAEVLDRVHASADRAAVTAQTVTHAVEDVPHRTADEVVKRIATHGDSSHSLPTVRPEPAPPGTDPESAIP